MSCFSKGTYFNSQSQAKPSLTRRQLFYLAGGFVPAFIYPPAKANGLLQFPPKVLNNRYYLVRAGESDGQSLGIFSTNPVDKQGKNAGLSVIGKKQVVYETIPSLMETGACQDQCWIWASITNNSYQTAEIIANAFNIGRSRLVPEYSFLDARGVGALNGRSNEEVMPILYTGDQYSDLWKPPRGTDGTPNESVQDIFIRCRQVMSILETQYFGEDVLIIAPDSDTLSVLYAALTNIDLRDHSKLSFRPGEVKLFSTEEL